MESNNSGAEDAPASGRDRLAEIRKSLAQATEKETGPKDGVVAVKVASSTL